MITRIKIKNFRKHIDSDISFGAGITLLRGANESSKTTTQEAIAYALFGSAALRDGIESVVTWGEHVNSLKVELDIMIDGVSYNIKRSKASAEVNYDGGMVTNQKEVTGFVSKLLKVDGAMAARLTLSNQNEVRGALEAGPKATSELIERLAEFDQLDTLVELMQEKLALGSPATAEAALASAQQQLERAEVDAVKPDTAAHELARSVAARELEQATARVQAVEVAESAAQEAYTTVRERIAARTALVQALEKAQGNFTRVEARETEALKTLAGIPEVANPDKAVADLQAKITAAGDRDAIAIKQAKVQPHTGVRVADAVTFEGTIEDLREELARGAAFVNTGNLRLSKIDGEVKLLEQALTHGSCTFCGQDFSDVPAVKARNAETHEKISVLEIEQGELAAKVREQHSDNETLRDIEMASRPALKTLAETVGYSELVDNELPPVLRWTGPTLNATDDGITLRAELKSLQASISARAAAAARLKDLVEDLATAEAELKAAEDLMAGSVEENADAAQAALNTARQETSAARAAKGLAEARVTAAQRAADDAAAAYVKAVALVEELKEVVESRGKEVKALEFNNALLKRVRQCRPLIVDKLWSIVLAAVSSYFSEIRGTPSVVSKDSEGFKIDEHAITSMSGSTLDALGLAIRVALVRTFLPAAPFLLLDEPAAAMDDNRTTNMLGFLSQCGFQQIIVASHDPISVDIADQVITL